ncbi:ABC transporter substrate-binding protein [Ruegeria atlantica]|uniref:ABC transporter substrate-binding protein n=1 Tax=Ruegeria atlantica TaxID=81569 RepID=UPI0020C3A5A5|nr:ABC transporter substrate-binding protein [Ruegeria atlantica]
MLNRREFGRNATFAGLMLYTASTAAFAQEESIKIGLLLPLSGGSAAVGNQTKTGAEVAAAQINEAGGVNGSKLELVFADSQSKPDIGVSETERLIQREEVAMVVGAYNSAVTFPSSEVAERYGVPWLVSGSVKNEITERGFRYIFRPNNKAFYDAREQIDAIDLLAEQTGERPESIGLFYRGDDWGRSHAQAVKQIAEERGYTISLDESYVPGQVDFSAQLLKIRSKKPGALIFVAGTADHILFNKQMLGNRIDLPFGLHSVGGGAEDPSFYEAVPEAGYEYMFTQEDWQIDRMQSGNLPAEVIAGDEAFEKVLGYGFNSYGAQGFSNIYIAADAIARAGSAERDAIRDALAATDITEGPALITGYQRVSFDENGQNLDAHGVISQNIAGERLTVWPQENRLESTTPAWPIPSWRDR